MNFNELEEKVVQLEARIKTLETYFETKLENIDGITTHYLTASEMDVDAILVSPLKAR